MGGTAEAVPFYEATATSNLITEATTSIANNGITENTVSPNQTFAVASAVGPCL